MKLTPAMVVDAGDEIKIDDQWWLVTEHAIDYRKPGAPITMHLRSLNFSAMALRGTITCGVGQQFECLHRCSRELH